MEILTEIIEFLKKGGVEEKRLEGLFAALTDRVGRALANRQREKLTELFNEMQAGYRAGAHLYGQKENGQLCSFGRLFGLLEAVSVGLKALGPKQFEEFMASEKYARVLRSLFEEEQSVESLKSKLGVDLELLNELKRYCLIIVYPGLPKNGGGHVMLSAAAKERIGKIRTDYAKLVELYK
jgi:hypothetical protein